MLQFVYGMADLGAAGDLGGVTLQLSFFFSKRCADVNLDIISYYSRHFQFNYSYRK